MAVREAPVYLQNHKLVALQQQDRSTRLWWPRQVKRQLKQHLISVSIFENNMNIHIKSQISSEFFYDRSTSTVKHEDGLFSRRKSTPLLGGISIDRFRKTGNFVSDRFLFISDMLEKYIAHASVRILAHPLMWISYHTPFTYICVEWRNHLYKNGNDSDPNFSDVIYSWRSLCLSFFPSWMKINQTFNV